MIVTGAASGIGKAFASLGASLGYDLALLDINQMALEKLKQELDTVSHKKISIHQIDVSYQNQWPILVKVLKQSHTRLDLLINNAGITLSPKAFQDIPGHLFDRVLEVNLYGALYAIRYLLPVLNKEKGCGIINMSSLAGKLGLFGYAPYAMSKMALRALGESLQMEFAGQEFHCLNVFPGGVKTNIIKNAPDIDPEKAETIHRGFHKMASIIPEKLALKAMGSFYRRKTELLLGLDAKIILFFKKILGPLSFPFLKKVFGFQTEMSEKLGKEK